MSWSGRWIARAILASLVLAQLAAVLPSAAADYPSRPLRLLVPFPPGGGNDLLARILAGRLTDRLGQQVVVDNRAGGGGVIATDTAAKAPPDGYTMALGFIGPLAISPNVGKVPYDPLGDLAALDILASSYHIVVSYPGIPVRSMKELIALARSQPGKLNYASSGSGTNLHLATELFKLVAGVDIVHVPYKGAGPAASAVLAGESQLFFGSIASSLPFVRSGRLIALAVTSPARSPFAPEVPTLAESGVSGVNVPSWYTLVVPARSPRDAIGKLRAGLKEIVSEADFREQLARQAIDVRSLAPGEFSAFLRTEIEKWGKVVRTVGIKPD
ncbi:MAG TPA: tripartite tricarboxylate transporter substrate binding protein [Burkholderiales bacterium]|nr:tripartite tricarboxylate transporter substrate binding protein [Burkholderiales bacterium]